MDGDIVVNNLDKELKFSHDFKMNPKPDIDDYYNGKSVDWDRYEFDLYTWKKSQGIELSESEKSFLELRKQKLKNGGLRDSQINLLKYYEKVEKRRIDRNRRIEKLCNLIEILLPIFAYQILKTIYNGIKKINR